MHFVKLKFNSFFILAGVVLIFTVLIFNFFFVFYEVTGSSMEDTLLEGDILLVKRFVPNQSKIRRGEIAIFAMRDIQCVKRCIGLTGNNIHIQDNYFIIDNKRISLPKTIKFKYRLFFKNRKSLLFVLDSLKINENNYEIERGEAIVNMNLLQMNFLYYSNCIDSLQRIGINFDTIQVPNFMGEGGKDLVGFFMLGDNFSKSLDSRSFGVIPLTSFFGKPKLIFLSYDCKSVWYKKFRWNRFLKRIE